MQRECRKRNLGLDLFRIICCLAVCAFHSQIHLGCSYGVLNYAIRMSATFMTAFFMLSGFSLYIVYHNLGMTEIHTVKTFYKKRLISILPMYYVISLIYVTLAGKEFALQNLLLAPIEILGIQSTFTSSLFSYSHNGGTWFISCILICYFLFPHLLELIKSVKKKKILIAIAIMGGVLLYAPIVALYFNTASLYSNPFYRLLEFVIGMGLAALSIELDENVLYKKYLYSGKAIAVEFFLLISTITVAVKMGLFVDNYMMYNWIVLPIFAFMLLSFYGIKNEMFEKCKAIRYASSLSYCFYLAQLFSNTLAIKIINKYTITNNWLKLLIGWSCVIGIAICFHEVIEKKLKKILI